MKNKGFTLIELLAVILILGIIALIAIPTVNSVIKQSRKGSYEQTGNQIVKGAETYFTKCEINNEECSNNLAEESSLKTLIDVKGDIPTVYKVFERTDNGIALMYEKDTFTCTNISADGTILDSVKCEEVSANDKVLFTDSNGDKKINIGDILKIDDQEFYVIKDMGTSVSLISKYNLNVGKNVSSAGATNITNATGLQDQTALGKYQNNTSYHAVTAFAETAYWKDENGIKPEYTNNYVYDSNSTIYPYLQTYKEHLKQSSIDIINIRLINMNELESLGCDYVNSCKNSPYDWTRTSSYWTGLGAVYEKYSYVYAVLAPDKGEFNSHYEYADYYGVRPVIEISKVYLK